jgi:diguanylate cyclase (GGDEF)-like protein/PAS domain S-box-containing protein
MSNGDSADRNSGVDSGQEIDEADLDRICLHNLLSMCLDTIYFKDLDSHFIRVSRSQVRHVGAAGAGDMLGKTDFDYFKPSHAEQAFASEQAIIQTGRAIVDQYENDAVPGTGDRVVSSTKQPLRDFEGRIIGTFGISRDVTARKAAERELLAKTAELTRVGREFKALLDSSSDAMSRLDRNLCYTYVNPAAQVLVGRSESEMLGRSDRDFGRSDDFLGEWEPALRAVLATGQEAELQHTVVIAGTRRFLHTRLVPETGEDGEVLSILAVSRDLTDRKRIEDALAVQAVHDPLTRLANRTLLVDRLNQKLHGTRGGSHRLAVLFVDLDRFKAVNDTLGHAAGDCLLVGIAARLREVARCGDLVARYGGDEFILLCDDIPSLSDAGAVARRVIDALAAPFDLNGHRVRVTASIGIAVTSDTVTNAEELLHAADLAMYEVKAHGGTGSGYVFFDALEPRSGERHGGGMAEELRVALSRDELRLLYQPVFDLRERRVVGAVAVVCWQHPERGLLPFSAFRDVAAERGFTVPMERWALREAWNRLSAWNECRRADRTDLTVGLALSAAQLGRPDLPDEIDDLARHSRAHLGRLWLAIPEAELRQASPATHTTLARLSALGVKIVLDGIGTAETSLGSLSDFPVNALQIAPEALAELDRPGGDATVAVAVTAMAHALGLLCLADGIEQVGQVDRLREIGCDLGLGRALSEPLPPALFEERCLG